MRDIVVVVADVVLVPLCHSLSHHHSLARLDGSRYLPFDEIPRVSLGLSWPQPRAHFYWLRFTVTEGETECERHLMLGGSRPRPQRADLGQMKHCVIQGRTSRVKKRHNSPYTDFTFRSVYRRQGLRVRPSTDLCNKISNRLHATCGGGQTGLRRGIHISFSLSFYTAQYMLAHLYPN